MIAATYSGWAGLVANHGALPWYVLWVLGGLVTAWHSSLIHESVHNLRCVPGWLRASIFFPPLGIWYPYFVYVRSHIAHHRNAHLTDPAHDPESFYYREEDWRRLSPFVKRVMVANQTFAGRMVLGPPIAIYRLFIGETRRHLSGDRENAGAWLLHGAALAVLFTVVSGLAGMPWWQYILCFAHPGLALTMVRSFIEHRAADDTNHRTASVEAGLFFGSLFLNNNLHVVHHMRPDLPWFRIPEFYRERRNELLQGNGGYFYEGYGEVVRRYLFKPTFTPVQPG